MHDTHCKLSRMAATVAEFMKASTSAAIFTLAALAVLGASSRVLAQSPYFPDFSSTANLTLNGRAAQYNGNILRLTPASQGPVGSAWFNIQQNAAGGFSTEFTFQISNTGNPGYPFPADGIAFVIQNDSAGTAAGYGVGGGSIAYGTNPDAAGGADCATVNGQQTCAITHSLAVEFDTYPNTDDPNANHVAVQSCGLAYNSSDENGTCNIGTNSNLPVTLADGNPHKVRIDYTPAASGCGEVCVNTLQVTLDGTALFGGAGLSVPELNSFLGLNSGNAWVGFTAATGEYVENNDILSWSFTPAQPQSQTQTLEPGVQSIYTFGSYNYKITPSSNSAGGEQLTITPVPTAPGAFQPGGSFPGAQCIVYADTGPAGSEICEEFTASCSGSDCSTISYQVSTSYNVPPNTSITGPGFLKADGQICPPVAGFDENIIYEFDQTRIDPTTKGGSGGLSCFVATQSTTDLSPTGPTSTLAFPNNFVGFLSPVDDPPTLNIAKAGQAIPIQWKLFDSSGNPITNLTMCTTTPCADGTVLIQSVSANCAGLAVDGTAQTTSTTGSSGLQNLGNGSWQYNWKTQSGWANTCRILQVSFGPGLTHTAQFQFH